MIINSVNSINSKQIAFKGTPETKMIGQMAGKLIAEERKLAEELPKGIELLNIFKLKQSFATIKKMKKNYAEAMGLIRKGQVHASVTKLFKRIGTKTP